MIAAIASTAGNIIPILLYTYRNAGHTPEEERASIMMGIFLSLIIFLPQVKGAMAEREKRRGDALLYSKRRRPPKN